MSRCILALDQGTTSSRAIVFDRAGRARAMAQREFPQHFPKPGWVEHDAGNLWDTTRRVTQQVLAKAGLKARDIAAVGLTNQRETTLLWDRATGRPVHRAIVWQDRRTAAACTALRRRGLEPLVQRRTGLLLDPYFSGTKLAWLLDHVPGARHRAARDLSTSSLQTALNASTPTPNARLEVDVNQVRSPGAPTRPGAVPPAVRTHTVVAGDTLSGISRRYYGTPDRWQEILNANRDVLKDDRSLVIGRTIKIP
jgi:nucleoid-associated protein YgaU